MDYYIKNATLVNEGQTFVASVFVSDGKIAKIVRQGDNFDSGSAEVKMPRANTSFPVSSTNMCISASQA